MNHIKPLNNEMWLTEQCPACCSVNHIFVPSQEFNAWECYHCQNAYWIDDKISREMYAIANGIDEYEADQHLHTGNLNIKYCQGHYEQN